MISLSLSLSTFSCGTSGLLFTKGCHGTCSGFVSNVRFYALLEVTTVTRMEMRGERRFESLAENEGSVLRISVHLCVALADVALRIEPGLQTIYTRPPNPSSL